MNILSSTPKLNDEYFSVAQIIAAYGVNGQFFVKTHQTQPSESVLHTIKKCFICKYENIAHIANRAKLTNNNLYIEIDIIKTKLHKDGILLSSQEFKIPEAIKPYVGQQIVANRADFPDVKNNEFYWSDLLKKHVINTNQQILGIVERMMDNGVQSILCIHAKPNAKFSEEILIPFTSTYIVEVTDTHIIVNWDESYI